MPTRLRLIALVPLLLAFHAVATTPEDPPFEVPAIPVQRATRSLFGRKVVVEDQRTTFLGGVLHNRDLLTAGGRPLQGASWPCYVAQTGMRVVNGLIQYETWAWQNGLLPSFDAALEGVYRHFSAMSKRHCGPEDGDVMKQVLDAQKWLSTNSAAATWGAPRAPIDAMGNLYFIAAANANGMGPVLPKGVPITSETFVQAAVALTVGVLMPELAPAIVARGALAPAAAH